MKNINQFVLQVVDEFIKRRADAEWYSISAYSQILYAKAVSTIAHKNTCNTTCILKKLSLIVNF